MRIFHRQQIQNKSSKKYNSKIQKTTNYRCWKISQQYSSCTVYSFFSVNVM